MRSMANYGGGGRMQSMKLSGGPGYKKAPAKKASASGSAKASKQMPKLGNKMNKYPRSK